MASRTASSLLRQLHPSAFRQTVLRTSSPLRHSSPLAPIALLRQPRLLRAAHTIPRPPTTSQRIQTEPEPTTATTTASEAAPAWQPEDAPLTEGERPEPKNPAYYQLSFTCVPCSHRSHHNVSKQGYHTGSVLITCPGCRNRHVISDHLNIFGDRKVTVEDLMREKGRLVKRGSLGEDGDIEFWPDEEVAADSKAGSS